MTATVLYSLLPIRIADALGSIAGAVSDDVIRSRNGTVAEGQRSEVEVARQFLIDGGWIKP